VLNRSNTHETRVHHGETPGRILSGDSGVGPVWISELQLAVNNGDALSGSQMPDSVNRPWFNSIAFLAAMDDDHRKHARDFFEFMLTDAQQIYTDGGFLPPTGAASAERYSFDKDGNFMIETFSP